MSHKLFCLILASFAFIFLTIPSVLAIPLPVPNALNQYSQVGGVGFSYDGNENLTSDGTLTLGYDSESRLITSRRGSNTATYTYDPFGRRLTKTVNGVVTRFLYDGDEVIAETNSGGAITAKYLYGPGIDEPLRQVRSARGEVPGSEGNE